MVTRGWRVPVQATPQWRRLMECLHDDANLDVWDERIIQAVLGRLEETVESAIEGWIEEPLARASLLARAGHEKAPATLESATGATHGV